MSTTKLTTPEVDIEKIDVVEGFNARRDFDPADLARLAETIKADGLVAPIDVRPGEEDGRFVLVAGERRYRAARLAGLKTIPVTVGKGNPRAAAFVENHHRANLNPIETALDLRAYAEEFGLTSNKKIAERANVNAAWVGEHLRLLRLPEEDQAYVAAGDVPLAAEPRLRKIAAVSPPIAAFVCEAAKENGISGNAFVERFAELLEAAGGSDDKDAPTMIRARGFGVGEVVADEARRTALVERLNATRPSYSYPQEDPTVRLGDEEVDAARAAGCLVEYRSERRDYSTTYAYITDAAFAADLIERHVERREREVEAAAEGWAAGGFRGIGVSTARSATNEIIEVGLPATSIAKLLILTGERAERGLEPLPPDAVIVVDEASAMSTPHAAALLRLAEGCGGKLVLIGDPRQIGAVGPAGIYGHLTRRLDPIELTEIRRQRAEVDRDVVRLAHEGRGSDALDVLAAEERLRIADTHEEALGALALDWHRRFAAGADAVMIARRNDDVARLNETAREVRRGRGELGPGIAVGETEFAVGDRVMTRVNTPEVSNRERWEVIGVERGGGSLTLRRLGGAEGGATLGRGYLRGATPDGDPALQHAYALTTYAVQGKTFEEAFVLLDPGISREDFVVAISRARGQTVAYGVAAPELTDEHLGPGWREIVDPLHDLRRGAERVAGEYPAVEVDARGRLESLGVVELARRRAALERSLAEAAESPPRARPTEARFELRLVEERMLDLRRRQVAAERLSATRPIAEALGPFPRDPKPARAWNEGVELIHGFRVRHGIVSPDGGPLGPISGTAATRREREAARRWLARIQRRLGQERARTAERALEIEM